MRSRDIKPGFYKSDQLAECSMAARLLFPGLWMLADREGRLQYRPKRIKAEVFPFDNVDIVALLDELRKVRLIEVYEVDGFDYIWIPKFKNHQSPHKKEKPSELPPSPNDVTHCNNYEPENSAINPGKPGKNGINPETPGKAGINPPDSLFSDLINSPLPPSSEGEEREPFSEFEKLRKFYTENCRSEGKDSGMKVFKAQKSAAGFPGVEAIIVDLKKRIDAPCWDPGYWPSLSRYLSERTWELPIVPRRGKQQDAPLPPPENIPAGWDAEAQLNPSMGDAFFHSIGKKPSSSRSADRIRKHVEALEQ